MRNIRPIILVLIFLISGCQEKTESHKEIKAETKSETQQQFKTENINKEKKEELERNELMDKMGYKHFKVTGFNIRILNNHKCEYNINYLMDSEMYDYLIKEKPTYYYAVRYPTNIEKQIGKYGTRDVKGEIPKDGRLSGTITITDQWHKDFDAKKMSKHSVDLQLYVKDKKKDEFYVIHDLNWYKNDEQSN